MRISWQSRAVVYNLKIYHVSGLCFDFSSSAERRSTEDEAMIAMKILRSV